MCLSFPHYTKLLGEDGPKSPLLLPRVQTFCPDGAQGPGSSVPGKRNRRARVLRETPPLQPKGERGRYVGLQAAARGGKSNVSRESLRRPPARRRRRERRVLGGERGTAAKGTMGEAAPGGHGRLNRGPLSPPPPPAGAPCTSPSPPRPPRCRRRAVPRPGPPPRPHGPPPLPPRLDPRPCPGPRRRSPLPARPPRTHLPRRAPGRQWGRDGTHLSGRSGGRGRPSLGGRGRAPARAPHLPLPAAREERARLGREGSGRGGTSPPPTAPSGGQSRHREGAADSAVAP